MTFESTSPTLLDRRAMLGALCLSGAGILGTGVAFAATLPQASGRELVLKQDLPDLALKGWQMTALDLTYAPGQADKPHRHFGFVFGFVIEGEVKFQVDGGAETVYKAGQMFYEAPGSVHRVSANASATKPCRFLAMVFADKSSPVAAPV
jgi:quercetin dioxygenase-like cupin family protein